MLSFFPMPYEDELLYSVLARYHIRSGNISPKMTMNELFGTRTKTAVLDLPSNLNYLINNLPLGFNCTADDLVMKHTLFPFYGAFLEQNRADVVKKMLESGSGGDIHTIVGIMASTIQNQKKLRCCLSCCEEDMYRYGEYYWHRLHQIPGLAYCPAHKELLQDSSVNMQVLNKHEYVAADEYNCKFQPAAVRFSSSEIDRFIVLAKDIAWLMSNYEAVSKAEGAEFGFRKQYVAILKEKGLATVNGQVYQAEFIDSFKKFYGDDFLDAVQSNVNYGAQDNWLSGIVRKHRKSFHPLRHLLLIRYLVGPVQMFFEQEYSYKPFGNGPWPCLNAAAEHYRMPIITNPKITLCCDTKQPIGTFHCICGFVYSRKGPDKTGEDLYRIGRIKAFGPIWEAQLKEYAEIGHLSMRETARKLNVDANTVKKYAQRLELKASWISSTYVNENLKVEEIDISGQKKSYRGMWIELMATYSEDTKTSLRARAPRVYAWLYRNDCDWLRENSPVKNSMCGQCKRVDWNDRDNQILLKAKQAVKSLLETDSKPERITIGRIGRIIGQLAVLEKHLEKIPMTKEYLKLAIESDEDFQIRRARWAVKQLSVAGQELKAWKIIRKAGLRPGYSRRVAEAISEALYIEINCFNLDMRSEGTNNA